MAVLRNHQLKVYNKFDAGEQNIPADHLIEDTAFSHASDVNVSDSTIRPIRGNRTLDVQIPSGTKTTIKENVKGQDTFLHFNTPIQFINYADTVFYIEDTESGSKLKQISTDGNLTKLDALPTLNSELTVTTTGTPAQVVNVLTQKLSDNFTNYKNVMDADAVQHTHSVAWRSGVLNLINLYQKPRIWSLQFDTRLAEDASIDTVKARLPKLQKAYDKIVTGTATVLSELDSDFKTRVQTFIHAYDVRPLMYNGYAVPTMYSGSVDQINLTLYKNRVEVAGVLRRAVEEQSLLKYIPTITVSDIDFSNGINIPNDQWDGCTSVYVPNKHKGFFISMVQACNKLANLLEGLDVVTEDSDKLNQMKHTFWEIPANAYLLSYVLNLLFAGSDSLMVVNSTLASEHNVLFNEFKEHLKEYQKTVEDVNYTDDISNRIVDYAVVGYDDRINAYTNTIRKSAIFEKLNTDITVQITPEPDISKYYLYRRTAKSTAFLKAFDIPSTGILTFNTNTIPKESGSTINDLYRVHPQPEDFIDIIEYKGTIFLVRKDSQEIWYCNTGEPHHIDTNNYIKMPQPVKAIQSAGAGVFVWTTNNTLFLLTGESHSGAGTNTLAIKLIAQNTSVIDRHSVVSIDTLVIWLSDYSFHNTSGYGSTETTKLFWTPPKITKVLSSCINHNIAYYLVDTEDEGRKLISYDYRLRRIFSHSANHYENLQEIDGKLTVFMDDESLVELFAGMDLKPYFVSLKRYAGYSFDTRLRFTNVTLYHDAKPYREIEYNHSNRTKVRIFIDGWLAGEEEIQGTQATRIDLPQTNNTGYSIRFELEGTLAIRSLRVRYTTLDWED